MKQPLRRVLLSVVLLAVLLASAIVPVYILLGISNRWFLFIPYALGAVALVILLARTDRSIVPTTDTRSAAGFVTSHLVLFGCGTLHVFLLAAKWLGTAGGDARPEAAALGFAAIALGKYFSMRHPVLARRPLWFEATVDAIAIATLFLAAFFVLIA
ncbi:MAG: hypothetical protein WC509_06080 [Candidatus Izemoplasmatales bacterium]